MKVMASPGSVVVDDYMIARASECSRRMRVYEFIAAAVVGEFIWRLGR